MAGIPSRAAEIKRDLGPMADALASRGGGGSASELRSDAGIFFQYGVEETLKRHSDLITVDATRVSISPLVSAVATAVFSFPNDHYVLGMALIGVITPGNMESFIVEAAPFGDPNSGLIAAGIAANFVAFPNAVAVSGVTMLGYANYDAFVTLPLFGRRETDYRITFRADAVGGCRFDALFYTVEAPQGVEIAH